MRKALVTGGSGFLGEILIRTLLNQNWEVFNLDLNYSDTLSPEKQFIGSILDENLCNSATQGMDAVFHNVANVPLLMRENLFKEINIIGTLNILEAAKKANVPNFIYTSSSAIYGIPESLPITHDSRIVPIEKYGESKFEAEQLCRKYESSSMAVKIIRPRTILGQGRLGIFSLFYKWIFKGYDIFILGLGNESYQFVHPQDLAEGLIKAIEINGNVTLNLGALDFGFFHEELEQLCSFSNSGSRVRRLPEFPFRTLLRIGSRLRILPFAPYQVELYSKSMYFDSKLDWEALNYIPRYSNLECLIEGFQWYQNNLDTLSLPNKSIHKIEIRSLTVKFIEKTFLRFWKFLNKTKDY